MYLHVLSGELKYSNSPPTLYVRYTSISCILAVPACTCICTGTTGNVSMGKVHAN